MDLDELRHVVTEHNQLWRSDYLAARSKMASDFLKDAIVDGPTNMAPSLAYRLSGARRLLVETRIALTYAEMEAEKWRRQLVRDVAGHPDYQQATSEAARKRLMDLALAGDTSVPTMVGSSALRIYNTFKDEVTDLKIDILRQEIELDILRDERRGLELAMAMRRDAEGLTPRGEPT
jgi:hypothetical protein